jgi:hypothetical protein
MPGSARMEFTLDLSTKPTPSSFKPWKTHLRLFKSWTIHHSRLKNRKKMQRWRLNSTQITSSSDRCTSSLLLQDSKHSIKCKSRKIILWRWTFLHNLNSVQLLVSSSVGPLEWSFQLKASSNPSQANHRNFELLVYP